MNDTYSSDGGTFDEYLEENFTPDEISLLDRRVDESLRRLDIRLNWRGNPVPNNPQTIGRTT
ncbi:MAG: hypothetical protein LBM98_00935 [Oscillospiraceae bacterium]|jgi:hypothetical protein|nr:hypothetical protein [Oscillospiraceae bacterium]